MADHIIIGGGIIGMLTARELRLAGADVTLLERNSTGRESSWAGGGIISPLYPWRFPNAVTDLARWSQSNYPALIEELHTNTGVDPELEPSGLLIVSPSEESTALNWGRDHHSNIQVIDGQALHELEPAMASAGESALWMPDVSQVRNPRLVKSLRLEIDRLGVNTLEHNEVREIQIEAGTATSVITDNGRFEAKQITVCAGAWSGQLLADLPCPPAVKPIKGQMILFRGEPGTISRITLEEDRYIIPRRDGRILFGSTLEESGFDKFTTEEARNELLTIARERFPILGNLEIEHHWAGLRPGSPLGVPYIGAHPEVKGLYINAGQYRNGVVLGPASARLMADILLERPTLFPATAYTLKDCH